MQPGMGAAQLGKLSGIEEAIFGGQRFQQVLRADDGVGFAQALDFRLDKGFVALALRGQDGPGEFKMAFDRFVQRAARAFQPGGAGFQSLVLLLFAFQEGFAGPGGAIEDGGGIRAGAHWAEVAQVFVFRDFLGFVNLQQRVGCRADNVSAFAGGIKGNARFANLDDVAFALPPG